MSDETRSALTQAFDAIEAGDLEAARAILQPILAQDRDNPDAWWIYSHAVTDPQEALNALENVTRIDPQYPGAAELLTTLRDRLPRRSVPESASPAAPPAPTSIPGLPGDEPDFEDDLDRTPARGMAPVEEEQPARSGLLPILAVLLLVIVVVALIISLLSQSQQQTPTLTPTSVAVVQETVTSIPFVITEDAGAQAAETEVVVPTAVFPPTVPPTDVEAGATDESPVAETSEPIAESTDAAGRPTATEAAAEATPALPEATDIAGTSGSEAETALLAGLRRYTLADEPITRQATSLGETLLVNVCVADRREATPALRPIMRAIANGTAALPADVAAVGARVLDCATGRAFVTMAIDRQSAEQHAAGTLSYVEFRELWQPQR